jgi:hypothetical protein
MAKKMICVLIMVGAAIGSASALDENWWKAYPDSFKAGTVVINAGLGLGYGFGGIAAFDVGVPIKGMPFSLGGSVGFNYWGNYGTSHDGIGDSYLYLAPAFRFGWHPNFGVKDLDAYVLVGIAVPISVHTYPHYVNGRYETKTDVGMWWASFVGAAIGARYYLSPKVGIYAELGYLSLNYATIGAAFKL